MGHYSSQSLSYEHLPFKIPTFYFSHETTTLITESSQWPPVDSEHKSVRFRLMINASSTPLHKQISNLQSLSRPIDPVISQNGMPSLPASTWPIPPIPPPPFPAATIMCSWWLTYLATDGREVGGGKIHIKRLRKYVTRTAQPVVHLSHALHFSQCQFIFTITPTAHLHYV